jgi:hypothetical protein
LSGSRKWEGGVLGPDGKIYGIPRDATDILIIDPAAGAATRSAMGANLSGSGKWYDGALGPDGRIYGFPFAATSLDILIIDPAAGAATRTAMGADLSGTNKWAGGVLGPDGTIYGIPLSATDILVIEGVPPGACTNPGRPEGAMVYNSDYRVMQYCDGASWIPIGKRPNPCDNPSAPLGTQCSDGSYFIGNSPEDAKKVYMTNSSYETDTTYSNPPICTWCGDGALAPSFTDGRANTNALLSDNPVGYNAAAYCDGLENVHGHSDWYLPAGGNDSTTEHYLFHAMKQAVGPVDGMGSNNDWYWSSTAYGANGAYWRRNDSGFQSDTAVNTILHVRCVRR